MPLFDQIAADVSRTLQQWRSRLAEIDLVPAQIETLAVEVMAELAILAQTTGGAGVDKREAVLAGVAKWYDEVIAPIDLPNLPDWLLDPAIRVLLLKFADKSLDGLVAVLKRYGKLSPVAA